MAAGTKMTALAATKQYWRAAATLRCRATAGHAFSSSSRSAICERETARLFFHLLAHAGPHVGHHEICAAGGGHGFVAESDAFAGGPHDVGIGRITVGAGDAQVEVEQLRGMNIRMAHIIAVAQPGDGLAADVAAVVV